MSPRLKASLTIAGRTLVRAVPTAFCIVILNFFLLQLAPGDAADVLAAEAGSATQESMDALRRLFGLDQPVIEQLWAYLGNVLSLNLGYSPRMNMPVSQLILSRLPNTLLLMVTSISIAIVLGVALGTVMAATARRLPDRVISILVLLFYSVPSFWMGLMLIVTFSIKLGWLPSGGGGTIGAQLTGFAVVWDKLRYMILPTVALSLFYVAIYARLTRASILEVYSQDYVRTAYAKGLSAFAVISRHVVRNALIPVTTLAGVHLGGLLGGAVVIETVYNWPGLGRLTYESIMARDMNVLMGILLLSSIVVIFVNMLVDILQAWLDPRVNLAR